MKEEGWKVYQVINESGKRSYIVIHDIEGDIEIYLDYDESVETDCWLSDILGCENEDVSVIKNW